MKVEPFALERFFAAHEFTTPHLLGVSDCETVSVGELLALEPGAADALSDLRLGYTESDGNPALRQAVAGTEPGLEPEQVVVHAAGVEILLTVSLALLEPGDHAVVQSPCYQAARSAPGLAGAAVTPWPARRENGWAPELDELPGLLRPETRLVIVNTPHNPTGYHFSEDELRALVRLAEEHGFLLLVDEAYRGGEYREEDRLPLAATLSPSVASLGLVSKAWGLPGLRTAWLASADPDLRAAVGRAKDYTTICAPAPAEFLATVALRSGGALLERNRALVVENLALLRRFMERRADILDWVPPRAVLQRRPGGGRSAACSGAPLRRGSGRLPRGLRSAELPRRVGGPGRLAGRSVSLVDPSFPVSAVLLAGTGFAAGIINVLAGGGSLLTLPVLIFVGLPPTVANGTNRVAILAQNVAASWSFRRHGLLPGGWLRLAAPPALAGAVLGIWLATQVGESTLQRVLAGIMVAVAVWTLWNPVKPRRDGEGDPPTGSVGRNALRVAFFGVGVYGGFIQAGLGFFILALVSAGGLDIIRGNALKVALVLVFTPLALAGFALSGMVDWALGASLAVGNLLGALVGVRLNMTRGENWVRGFVVVMVVIFAVRLWFSA